MVLIPMPMIGGPRDGEIRAFQDDERAYNVVVQQPIQWSAFSSMWDAPPDIVTYLSRRVVGIMPGRTDRQWFRVMVAPGVDLNAALSRAIRAAWARGWAPPDRQSEFWPCGPDATEADRAFFALYLMGAVR